MKREFYRSTSGPEPMDVDAWHLVRNPVTGRLIIRHLFATARNSGFEEYPIDEFLAQHSAAEEALMALLFGESIEAQVPSPVGASRLPL
jgi:hypothetical protein